VWFTKADIGMYLGKAEYFSKVPPIILAKLQKKDFFQEVGRKYGLP
jgi:hypothetical protein